MVKFKERKVKTMNLNGGYAMIAQDATQKDLEIAYKTKRPVLLYDANHRAHWAQINEKVIETVDEETQETITTYEYSYQLLNAIEALVDDSGNPRFIEGNGTPATITGFTSTYCKWSLSGTHLMLVFAGILASGFVLEWDTNLRADFDNIPAFILDKVALLYQQYVDKKIISIFGETGTESTSRWVLSKEENKFVIRATSGGTITEAKNFRVQFDLLIDNE